MQLIAISAGKIRNLLGEDEASARSIPSAIDKRAISTLDAPDSVQVRYLGLDGDEQADLRVHGGEYKAIYAYPFEHYGFWNEQRQELGKNLPSLIFGAMGENFTTRGFTEDRVFVGDQWRIGNVVLEVVKFREPCFKFNIKMGWSGAAKAMIQSGFSGWYLRVIKSGTIQAGDAIQVIPGVQRISILQQSEAYYAKQEKN